MPVTPLRRYRQSDEDLATIDELDARWKRPGDLPNRTRTIMRAVRECLERERVKARPDAPAGT